MLPSRGRILRVLSACVALILLAYLATLTTTWRANSPQVTSYFSIADDSGNRDGGSSSSLKNSRTQFRKPLRVTGSKIQDVGWKGDKTKRTGQRGDRDDPNDGEIDAFGVQKSNRKRDFSKQDGGKVSNEDQERGGDDSARGRDHKAVLPIPSALTGLIANWSELKGRHSDYITTQCWNKSSLPVSITADKKYDFIGPFPYLENYKNPCWLPKGATKVFCVPYFYLIGAPKAGSTDVFWRIKGHPYVTSGRAKEVRWFDRLRFPVENGTRAAMPRFEDYLEFFERPTRYVQNATVRLKNGTVFHHRVIADGSPTYYYSSFNWPMMPGNEGCHEPRVTAMSHVHHLWPGAKLILVLRNPVTRLFSTYLYNTHLTGFNTSAAQFDLWVKQSMDAWFRCVGVASFRHCMYDRRVIYDSAISTFAAGMYSRYVLDLLKLFPRKQIYFVHLESYSTDIKNTLKKIFSFLNLPALSESDLDRVSRKDESKRNRGRNYAAVPDMWPSTRKLLEHFYAPYNAELSAILNNDPRWLWS